MASNSIQNQTNIWYTALHSSKLLQWMLCPNALWTGNWPDACRSSSLDFIVKKCFIQKSVLFCCQNNINNVKDAVHTVLFTMALNQDLRIATTYPLRRILIVFKLLTINTWIMQTWWSGYTLLIQQCYLVTVIYTCKIIVLCFKKLHTCASVYKLARVRVL